MEFRMEIYDWIEIGATICLTLIGIFIFYYLHCILKEMKNMGFKIDWLFTCIKGVANTPALSKKRRKRTKKDIYD